MKKESTPRTLIREAVRGVPSGTKLAGSSVAESPPQASGKDTMKAFISEGSAAPPVDEGPPKAFPAYSYSAAAAPAASASSGASTLHHRQTPGQFSRPGGGAASAPAALTTPVATPQASRSVPPHEQPPFGAQKSTMSWFEFYLIFVNILLSTGILATVFAIALLTLTKEKSGTITPETVKETLYLTVQELAYDATELATSFSAWASRAAGLGRK